MYKEFDNINSLLDFARTDKQAIGDAGFIANRYPIRFVLFDNFLDSFEFINQIHCKVQSVEKWLDADYPDIMITHTALADHISKYISTLDGEDVVIAPFSEMARFYNNNESSKQFDTLLRTIKSTESSQKGFQNKQRIYIPIVGLEGKMSMFAHDTEINIWYFKNIGKQNNYRLILTNSTFGVSGLEQKYTIVENVKQWMSIWRKQEANPKIISLSKSLLAYAEYACPDNAFDFYTCNNVYDFLTKGLELDFGDIEYKLQDEKHWLRLATEIDIDHFSFETFFNRYFHIDELADYKVFLKTWSECNDEFGKWLLCTFYLEKFCNNKSYICQCIKNSKSYTNADFFASIALTIFDCEDKENYTNERKVCMDFAKEKGIKLSIEVETQLKKKLEKTAEQQGCIKAIEYFSQLTYTETGLIIYWLGIGKIKLEYIENVYPDLYYYLSGNIDGNAPWVSDYFKAYRECKIANRITDDAKLLFSKPNSDIVTFNNWFNSFKTTKTVLSSRADVEIFYWIDGLGIEWIPFIKYLLSNKEGVYLNETYIARASYPTTTVNNKVSLESLAHNDLRKIGDLDTHAHKNTNKYPEYIIEEIEIVNNAIRKIVDEYSGKKIAIVSDHGLTALSQFFDGLKLAGYNSDHGGRLATKETSGSPNADNNYLVCDDGKTICALKHNSLCGKIPTGQSAHGGCTPEEILVPIFIVSSQEQSNNYTAKLLTTEIIGNNPVVEFEIKGDNITDTYIVYANKRYKLTKTGNVYRSETLTLVAATTSVTLHIGTTFQQTFNFKINIGAEEDDLFDFNCL